MQNIFNPICLVLFFIPFSSLCQPADKAGGIGINFNKANQLQVVSYKPKAAKAGKDGGERFVLFQIGKGPKSGQSGKSGKTGPSLHLRISYITLADSGILQLVVISDHKTDTFYVDPLHGQIKIIADGGDGGAGGRGEQGASDGTGGQGGDGGSIDVVFDESATSFCKCSCLVFSNVGGAGGWNGDNSTPKQAQAGKSGPPIYLKDEKGKILAVK